MDLDSGKIRPRRRDAVGSQNAPTESTAERSTRLLIRLPHLALPESAQDTSAIRPNVPSAAIQTQRVDKPAAIRPAPRIIATPAASVGSITTGPSPSAKSVADVTVTTPAADLPAAESVTRWRIDAAHVSTPSTHSAANRQEASRNNWLAQIAERKSLLAIGIIALATGIIAIGVVMFNQSHQQLSAPVRPDAASFTAFQQRS